MLLILQIIPKGAFNSNALTAVDLPRKSKFHGLGDGAFAGGVLAEDEIYRLIKSQAKIMETFKIVQKKEDRRACICPYQKCYRLHLLLKN